MFSPVGGEERHNSMGKKGGRSHQKKEGKNSKTSSQHKRDAYSYSSDDMDDEIDTFHKQRDIVPLNINDGTEESDEDEELPIFDVKDVDEYDEDDDDDDEEDDDDDEEEDDDDEEDDGNGHLAKMIRQRKYLRSKFGGGDDTIDDGDEDEDEDGYKLTLGGKKFSHGAENRNFELQSSDDEAPKEEEELALQIQREKAKSLTMEDYDLVDLSEDKDNGKLTLKEASDKGNEAIKPLDRDIIFSVDELNSLTKEEQMNVLYRSAPELVGWLSELNEAHKQLECEINPFLSKVETGKIVMKGEARYFELKQLILLSYCQAITFYLLLKSEGQSVHDHPITARLEEIKKLSDQIKQLDRKLPVKLEDILVGNNGLETVLKSDNENSPMAIDSITKNQEQPPVSAKSGEEAPSNQDIQKLGSSNEGVQKTRKVKPQKDHIGAQSLEMLKVRASLEEKLKKKGLYVAPKPTNGVKRSRPVNGQLETYDDFNDDNEDVTREGRLINGSSYKKVSQFLNANMKKPKVVSGDDDLPKRDEIGERRRKHELRVLAGAGIKTEDDDDSDRDDQMGGDLGPDEVEDADDDDDDNGSGDSENEFYKQVEQLRAAKLAAKAEAYSRNTSVSSQLETVEGKRLISSQMEKNRGLTRNRNKAKKNPRKNYKLKHQKAVKNRKGQVQSIRRPTAPYGGETSGINAAVSRSIRFKS
ncbi:something about silencing protein 10 isoform X2 [Vigna umbellata]|uniref:something about silencing protein 10 isoform X2 n=1 Tax=Vigna umbellata TaxID=87088 RepID=UPI001F5E5719|nr:something about silencing protein 10 isoform X2 [Vigna umbellata]